jgi:hypothetical protein
MRARPRPVPRYRKRGYGMSAFERLIRHASCRSSRCQHAAPACREPLWIEAPSNREDIQSARGCGQFVHNSALRYVVAQIPSD